MGTRHEARWRGHPRLTTFPFGPVWPSIPVTPWMRLKKETKCRRINNCYHWLRITLQIRGDKYMALVLPLLYVMSMADIAN